MAPDHDLQILMSVNKIWMIATLMLCAQLNNVGSFTCQCSDGFQGNGRTCTGLLCVLLILGKHAGYSLHGGTIATGGY